MTTQTKVITVGLVQHACSEDREKNLATSIDGVREATRQGAQLVLLQELHTSIYFCQREDANRFDLAEPIPGPTTEMLGRLANKLGIVIVGSTFEQQRTTGLYHNTAVVLDANGALAGTYRKMHIPNDPGYYEKFYFTPGDQGFEPIPTSLGKLGVLVCWDQWFPEAARLMALRGAELLLYPSAIGWDPRDDAEEKERQFASWMTIQRGHAIANGLPLMSCNRVGHEADPGGETPGIDFWGGSFIAGPQGEILAQASTETNSVLMVELDLARSEVVRSVWPLLRDRRIDAYDGLNKQYGE